ncbi:hypothetical protein ACRAWB_01870 [Leifsonia poae]|uniref:hypothetical protein n=1 Tax=Leifsonia poae TaxID=110933 RepID=UPI003D687BDD
MIDTAIRRFGPKPNRKARREYDQATLEAARLVGSSRNMAGRDLFEVVKFHTERIPKAMDSDTPGKAVTEAILAQEWLSNMVRSWMDDPTEYQEEILEEAEIVRKERNEKTRRLIDQLLANASKNDTGH